MASSPDYSGQNAAAVMGAQDARDMMNWSMTEYNRQRPQADESRLLTLQNQRNAQQMMDGTIRPAVQSLISDASAYDNPGARSAAANAAQADVQNQFGTARQGTLAAMARRGISGAAAGEMLGNQDVALAAARAGAGANAARAVQDQGFARRSQALGLATGVSTGGAGVGANAGMVGQAAGNMTNATSNLVSTMGNINAAQQQNANSTNQAIGTAAGLAAMMAFSDKNMKENIEPESGKSALEQIKRIPVSSWSYKDDPTGETRTGPMAQDVREEMGDVVAPDGKVIDLVSMNGKSMAAIQELDKRMSALEAFAAKSKRA